MKHKDARDNKYPFIPGKIADTEPLILRGQAQHKVLYQSRLGPKQPDPRLKESKSQRNQVGANYNNRQTGQPLRIGKSQDRSEFLQEHKRATHKGCYTSDGGLHLQPP